MFIKIPYKIIILYDNEYTVGASLKHFENA